MRRRWSRFWARFLDWLVWGPDAWHGVDWDDPNDEYLQGRGKR